MGRQEISGHALGKWALLKGPAVLSYRNLFTFVQAQSYQIPQIHRLQSTPKDSNPLEGQELPFGKGTSVGSEAAGCSGLTGRQPAFSPEGISNTHILLLEGLQAAPCPDGQFLSAFSSL